MDQNFLKYILESSVYKRNDFQMIYSIMNDNIDQSKIFSWEDSEHFGFWRLNKIQVMKINMNVILMI